MTVAELRMALIAYKDDAIVLIESSDGEYGPRLARTIMPHKGKDEKYGVDGPAPEKAKGVPVIRA